MEYIPPGSQVKATQSFDNSASIRHPAWASAFSSAVSTEPSITGFLGPDRKSRRAQHQSAWLKIFARLCRLRTGRKTESQCVDHPVSIVVAFYLSVLKFNGPNLERKNASHNEMLNWPVCFSWIHSQSTCPQWCNMAWLSSSIFVMLSHFCARMAKLWANKNHPFVFLFAMELGMRWSRRHRSPESAATMWDKQMEQI